MTSFSIIQAFWIVFALVWLAASLATKRTQQKASLFSRLAYRALVTAGCYLMFAGELVFPRLRAHVLPPSTVKDVAGIVLTASGIALAMWARFYIGSNWSSAVTVKVGHELVRTGPYRWVRHPIYAGILLALIGTGLSRNHIAVLPGIALCWLGFLLKSRMEENFMRQTFGEQYVEYCETVGALVPKVRL